MTSVHLAEAPRLLSLLGRWAAVVITAAFFLALCESIFLAPSLLENEAEGGVLALSALLFGNWLPYTALGASVLVVLEVSARWLVTRSRSPLWLAPALAVLVLPYAAWLAHYAMSGPNVGSHPLRRVGILVVTALVAAGFSAVTTLVGYRQQGARFSLAIGVLACALAGGALWLSGIYLPNEYEPLHAALGYIAILSAVIGAGELSRERRFLYDTKVTIALCAVFAVSSLASGWILAESNHWAWLVWGETPGSRYVTARWTWEEEDTDTLEGPSEDSHTSHQNGRLHSRHSARPTPHIFVFSIDNLQPSHVGAYGYTKRPSTPSIDQLAQDGTLFRRAYSYQPQTRVFMTSMLLGRRLPDFGAHVFPPFMQETSLTRLLKDRDYFTLVKGVFELTKHRKFKPSDYLIDKNIKRESAEVIRKTKRIPHIPYADRFRIVERHLKKSRGRPVFVWVHLLGPHWSGGSFSPSDDFPFGNSVDAKYDSAIAGTDQWLGRLQQMARKHLKDERDIYWIVMSDHGAGLTEGKAKRESGKSILERHVHVPLIIAGPGIQRGEVDVPVDAALDTAATILDLAGINQPSDYDGISLVPVLEGQDVSPLLSKRIIPLRNSAWTGAVHAQWKYVNYRKVNQLFDLSQDPGETRNLADKHPKLVRRLRSSSRKQLRAAEEARRSMGTQPNDVGEEE